MVDESTPTVPDLAAPVTPILVDHERQRRELEQLRACKADLASSIGRQIDWLLEMEADGMLRSAEEMEREPFGIAEASARVRCPLPPGYDPGTDAVTGQFEPEQVTWNHLGTMLEHAPERGRDLWSAIKAAARQELQTGVRSADALESPLPDGRNPWQRARFLALMDALIEDLRPRGALEGLLIQRMASTYELCLRWQGLAIERQELEEWQSDSTMRQEQARMSPAQRERHRLEHGYLPPRLSQSEAIQEAALMAERYERAFLRLVREFRNQRRVFANLIVAAETVNIAEGGPQQVNVSGGNAK